jgi:hypothetical protein
MIMIKRVHIFVFALLCFIASIAGAAMGPNGVDPCIPYTDDFNTKDANWIATDGGAFNVTTNPGYATFTDSDIANARVVRWFYNYGDTNEWDLEVRMIPNKDANDSLQGIEIWNTLNGGKDMVFCYQVQRFWQADGFVVSTGLNSDLRIPGHPRDRMGMFWSEQISTAGNPSYVKEVFFKIKKRYTTLSEIIDKGRFYMYYKTTVDPNDGNSPVTSGWVPFCYAIKANLNAWGQRIGGPGTAKGGTLNDPMIGIFTQNLKPNKKVLYDYFKFTVKDGLVLPAFCGDFNTQYSSVDLNLDCYVDLIEWITFASHWLYCTDPEDPMCDQYWKP